ncbi:hypothetical protein QAD02_000482 [Eretmocerus hayati]|uniref:Uncharacterized protein n=1 Tax=Eretmocerus hayati TaxID=131215 RepID=A0ACC2NE55_9HYME|nr:hypothetical protein QAD02_000482 [Eretmocerus hayati]
MVKFRKGHIDNPVEPIVNTTNEENVENQTKSSKPKQRGYYLTPPENFDMLLLRNNERKLTGGAACNIENGFHMLNCIDVAANTTMEFISVRDGSGAHPMNIPIQKDHKGKKTVTLETIKDYYPNADGVEYHVAGEIFGLNYERGVIYLNPDVKEYEVRYPKTKNLPLAGSKLKMHRRIMAVLDGREENVPDDPPDYTIGVEKPKKTKIGCKEGTRSMKIGWKHRSSEIERYKQVTAPLGGVKEVSLDLNQEYSYDDILDICVNRMRNTTNQLCLDFSRKVLGKFNDQEILSFTNEDDNECGFWEYVACKTSRGSRLSMYILSTDLSDNNGAIDGAKQNEAADSTEGQDVANRSIDGNQEPGNIPICQAVTSSTTSRFQEPVSSKKAERCVPGTSRMSLPAQVQLQKILHNKTHGDPAKIHERRKTIPDTQRNVSFAQSTTSNKFPNVRLQNSKENTDRPENPFKSLFNRTEDNRLNHISKTTQSYEGCVGSGPSQSSNQSSTDLRQDSGISRSEGMLLNKNTPQSSMSKLFGGTRPQHLHHEKRADSGSHMSVQSTGSSRTSDQVAGVNFDKTKKTHIHGRSHGNVGERSYQLASFLQKSEGENTLELKSIILKGSNNSVTCLSVSRHVLEKDDDDKSGDETELVLSIPELKRSDVEIPSQNDKDNVLGSGSYGYVVKARFNHDVIAVKCIKMTLHTNRRHIIREISIMDKLRQENIVQVSGYIIEPRMVYILMEYVPGCNLRKILMLDFYKKKFNADVSKRICWSIQLCRATNYMHTLNPFILHRDIKPENILIDYSNNLKLCDFGLGRLSEMPEMLESTVDGNNVKGTPLYLAPEIVTKNMKATTKSDTWSTACVVVEIFTERKIWEIKAPPATYSKMEDIFANHDIPDLNGVPLPLQTVLKPCFCRDPSRRADVKFLLSSLETIGVSEKLLAEQEYQSLF